MVSASSEFQVYLYLQIGLNLIAARMLQGGRGATCSARQRQTATILAAPDNEARTKFNEKCKKRTLFRLKKDAKGQRSSGVVSFSRR